MKGSRVGEGVKDGNDGYKEQGRSTFQNIFQNSN